MENQDRRHRTLTRTLRDGDEKCNRASTEINIHVITVYVEGTEQQCDQQEFKLVYIGFKVMKSLKTILKTFLSNFTIKLTFNIKFNFQCIDTLCGNNV